MTLAAQTQTRVEFSAMLAGGFVPADGTVYQIDELLYRGQTGASVIADLLGLVPAGDVTPEHFGAEGDGVVNDAAALIAFTDYLRSANVKGFMAAKPYYIADSTFPFHGCDIEGIYRGYRNSNGTRIIGNQTGIVAGQTSNSGINTWHRVKNIRFEGGGVSVACVDIQYSLWSEMENIDVMGAIPGAVASLGRGMDIGRDNVSGPLFVRHRAVKIWSVPGTGLRLRGQQWHNASSFQLGWYSTTDSLSGAVDIDAGGIGAIANMFDQCEFAGNGYGIVCRRVEALEVRNGYFETLGPALINLNNCSVTLHSPVFAKLRNDHASGYTGFIQQVSGTFRVTCIAPYVYLADLPQHVGIALTREVTPGGMVFGMSGVPRWQILGSGFGRIATGQYTPVWTASVTNPSIGNGMISARYTRDGQQVCVQFELLIGSTTALGSGIWSFSLPVSAKDSGSGGLRAQGISDIVRPGVGRLIGRVEVLAGSSSCSLVFAPNSGGFATDVTNAHPVSWVAGDILRFTLVYQAD